MITHDSGLFTILRLAHSSDRDVVDSCLELDQRVSSVVSWHGQSFAACAEVGIMAHSALVANTGDARFLSNAQWPVAKDAIVALVALGAWLC